MRNQSTHFSFLLGILLTGCLVVADETPPIATDKVTTAVAPRVSFVQRAASAAGDTPATPSPSPFTPSAATTNTLPALPPGVTELKFGEFFRMPIGPRGMELTETLRALDGRRVRLIGFMVREHEASRTGSFLLAPYPVTLDEAEFGLCDDLPASATLVYAPYRIAEIIPHQPGRIIVTGTLSVGAHAEASGRVFLVRLKLDAAATAN
jgi:hypothetical protein